MNVLTVKPPAELHGTLTSEERRRNVTRTSLFREIIENALVHDTNIETRSCTDLPGDLVGAVSCGRSGPATNRRLLDEAVAQGVHRSVTDRRR